MDKKPGALSAGFMVYFTAAQRSPNATAPQQLVGLVTRHQLFTSYLVRSLAPAPWRFEAFRGGLIRAPRRHATKNLP